MNGGWIDNPLYKNIFSGGYYYRSGSNEPILFNQFSRSVNHFLGEGCCQKIIVLHLHLCKWPHSLMDRMEDSGSFDLGSNPGGVTKSSVID